MQSKCCFRGKLREERWWRKARYRPLSNRVFLLGSHTVISKQMCCFWTSNIKTGSGRWVRKHQITAARSPSQFVLWRNRRLCQFLSMHLLTVRDPSLPWMSYSFRSGASFRIYNEKQNKTKQNKTKTVHIFFWPSQTSLAWSAFAVCITTRGADLAFSPILLMKGPRLWQQDQ